MLNLPFTMRQLEVFASLCESKSFAQSAEKLGISQASISSQMKVLEEQLGLRLLIRRPGKRPSLTPEGLAFREDLRAFEESASTLAAHRRNEPQMSEPIRFRLLVGQGMWDNFIRPKLDHFLVNNPRINLEFEAQPPNDRLSRVLADGMYDFALLHLRADTPLEPNIRPLALLRGGVYGHRDFAKAGPLKPADIAQLPFVLPPPGSVQEREALKGLERHAISPRRVVCHSRYYDVIAAMLERGVAVSSFTEALIPRAARDDVVLLYPLENWRLVWFRKDRSGEARRTAVESFLISSVLLDPDYPAIEIYDYMVSQA